MEISLENISYETKNKKILDNINFNIKENSITTIMGKSGSGKSTLGEIIDILTFQTNGILKIDNQIVSSINQKELKQKIGLVFQFPEEQFFCSTVEKEIEFGLNCLNKDIEKIKEKVKKSLIMVGLDENYLTRNPFTLSSGEKRKVAIASVLASNPSIIILDEPTLGLDCASKNSLINILKMLKNKYNKTIVILSKDSELAHLISEKVIIIYNGQVVLQGNKYDVFTKDIEKYGLKKPKIIEFEQLVLKDKNIKLFYRDNINDLMKDVYRNVR